MSKMIQEGSKAVTIRNQEGSFFAISMVNFTGDVRTATVQQSKWFNTLNGAERWARKQVA